MKKMNKLIALLALYTTAAFAAGVTQIPNDQVTMGKRSSSADKRLVIDINQGVNNPEIRSVVTDQDLQLRADTVRVGKPAVGNKTLDFNQNLGAANPKIRYNSGAAKIEFSNNGTDFKAIGSGSGGGSGITVLGDVNADFESGSGSWTASGGSFTIATTGSNLLFETRSGVFNSSAAAQTLSNTAINTSAWGGLKGNAASAACFFKTSATDYKIQVYDGTNVLSERVIPASTIAIKIATPFLFPSTGTVQLRVISQSDASDIAIDNCFMGSNEGVQLSQANYIGGVTYPRALNCGWGFSTTTSFGGFPADSDCTGAVARGRASVPSTLIPAVKFSSMPKGTYVFKPSYGVLNNNVATGPIYWRVSDGTNHSTRVRQTFQGTPNTATSGDMILHLSSPVSNATFEIQAASDSAGQGAEINNDTASSTLFPDWAIDVYYYPDETQQAYTFDTLAFSWSGVVDGNTTITSPSMVDLPGTPTIVEKHNQNAGTVTISAASNGITFTPSRAGSFEVCASGYMSFSLANASADAIMQLNGVDIGNAISHTMGTNGGSAAFHRCNQFKLTSTSPAEVKLRAQVNSGNLGVYSVLWTVKQLDQQVPAPVIAGGVVSPLAGVMNIVSVAFAGNVGETAACTTDPCTIARQSGGVTSVTRVSPGAYDVNFAAGTFSAPPVCTGARTDIITIGPVTGTGIANTSTVAHMYTTNLAGSASDDGMHVICIGPK